jgi:hypothetical protein
MRAGELQAQLDALKGKHSDLMVENGKTKKELKRISDLKNAHDEQ